MKSAAAVVAAVGLACTASNAWADLSYTVHTTAHEDASAAAPDAIGAITGAFMAGATGMADRTDRYFVSAAGVRVESGTATIISAAGSVTLGLADGTMAMLNPADKTYWRLPDLTQIFAQAGGRGAGLGLGGLNALPMLSPQVTVTRPGDFETIEGHRAEHVRALIDIAIPLPPGMPMPAGFPSSMQVTIDVWKSTDLAQYSDLVSKITTSSSPAALLGFDPAQFGEGFTLRQTTTGSMLGRLVMESATSDIVEGPLAPELFQIPADYKEVPMPQPDLGALLSAMPR